MTANEKSTRRGNLMIQNDKVKQTWSSPTIEEVDYAETEAAGGPGAVYDGIYFYSSAGPVDGALT
jgi:hypothetical protein